MVLFGTLGFTTPWILVAMFGLPLLWLVLRATPPAPVRRVFPAVVLLLGLTDRDSQADRTPPWLLVLRIVAVGALIVGFAGPVLNPPATNVTLKPLLILRDGGWPSAPTWQLRQDRIIQAIETADLQGRRVAVVSLAKPNAEPIRFDDAGAVETRITTTQPAPKQGQQADIMEWITAQTDVDAFDTIWVSDGLETGTSASVLALLQEKGTVTVFAPNTGTVALRPVTFDRAEMTVTAVRSATRGPATFSVTAKGTDPAGRAATLGAYDVVFDDGTSEASVTITMPSELRNRLTHFAISSEPSTGATVLLDGRAQRRKIALIGGGATGEGLRLLDPLHYLRGALSPTSELLSSDLADALTANPDVVILADIARLTGVETDLRQWVEAGGVLLRFAGPRLAASAGQHTDDPLLPVRLRAGGRDLGGAMSWGAPKTLAPFDDTSPFTGLGIPDDIAILSQVLAEPAPELASRTLASLTDGTPLVTRHEVGDGQVILFHVTANAEWSNLPLTGLFVDMLDRLSIAPRADTPTADDVIAQNWQPVQVLDGVGAIAAARDRAGVGGAELYAQINGGVATVGTYGAGGRMIAVNAVTADTTLTQMDWPRGVTVETQARIPTRAFGGQVIALGAMLVALDIFASLWAMGKLRGAVHGIVVVAAIATADHTEAQSRDDVRVLEAANNIVLAYVETGVETVDSATRAGLFGLGVTLFRRTSVEPIDPVAIDLMTDELAVYPFIYWPIVASSPVPSGETYRKLNAYLRGGGMIVFDTRDDGIAGLNGTSPERRHLQRIALGLDIPPLMPVPPDHVLTRSYYLLQEFPGRHVGGTVWVEATVPSSYDAAAPTVRNQNDGVTPVVIGGADWAAAWAMDDRQSPLYAVGRGIAGERQREIALRFGVNLVMHVFTGNYKTDQAHMPDLLERLGE